MKITKTDPKLLSIIEDLRRTKVNMYKDLAKRMLKQRRLKKPVNVGKLEKVCRPNDEVVVYTKLLGSGSITKPVIVYCYKYSKQAYEKIVRAKGKIKSINEMIKENKKPRMIG